MGRWVSAAMKTQGLHITKPEIKTTVSRSGLQSNMAKWYFTFILSISEVFTILKKKWSINWM